MNERTGRVWIGLGQVCFVTGLVACAAPEPDISTAETGLSRRPRHVERSPDTDGDSIPDAQDACLDTPPRARTNANGCSSLDLIRQPERTVAFARALADEARELLRAEPTLAELAPTLQTATLGIGDAALALATGDPCLARDHSARSVAAIETTRAPLEDAIRTHLARTRSDGDVGAADVLTIRWRRVVDRAQWGAQRLREDMGAACGSIDRTFTLHNVRIRAVDDATGELRFTPSPGRYVAMTPGGDIATHAYVGGRASVSGIVLDDGTAVAQSLVPHTGQVTDGSIGPGLATSPCLGFRIAPAQPFQDGPPYVLHQPAGYIEGAPAPDSFHGLWLETGMRVAAQSSPCSEAPPARGFYRQSLEVVYRPRGISHPASILVASDLTPSKTPVALPDPATVVPTPNFNAVLVVRHQRQSCVGLGNCAAKQLVSEETFAIRIRAQGEYCTAKYLDTTFLESDIDSGIATTFVNGDLTLDPASIFPAGVGSAGTGFRARGRVPLPGGGSADSTISAFEDFLIPSVEAAPDTAQWAGPFLLGAMGVDHQAALTWPHVEGQRAGRSFWYSCRVPTLVRDLIDDCPGGTDTYFRLPFTGGYPTWTGGQPHNGPPQLYAYDLGAPLGTPILAARGGVVDSLRQNVSNNSNPSCGKPGCTNTYCIDPNCCEEPCPAGEPGNYVILIHSDGSYAMYYHQPLNWNSDGPQLQLGSFVPRGGDLGVIGVSGNTSGPHTHIETGLGINVPPGGSTIQTMPMVFEAIVGNPNSLPITCYIPQSGDQYYSTNN